VGVAEGNSASWRGQVNHDPAAAHRCATVIRQAEIQITRSRNHDPVSRHTTPDQRFDYRRSDESAAAGDKHALFLPERTQHREPDTGDA
jgi:hypothetical protein